MKFSIYNLTIFDTFNKDCHCFIWDGTNDEKGSSEIATCILKYLMNLPDKCQSCEYFFRHLCRAKPQTVYGCHHALCYSDHQKFTKGRFEVYGKWSLLFGSRRESRHYTASKETQNNLFN